MREFVDQQIGEGTDLDPIVNTAFVKDVSWYYGGQGSGFKSSSRKVMNGIQENLQAQQKEVDDEFHKRQDDGSTKSTWGGAKN